MTDQNTKNNPDKPDNLDKQTRQHDLTGQNAENHAAFTLYGYYRSSTSFRVRMALAYKNIAYEYISVNLLAKEHQSTEFKAIHPQGLVPALAHDGHVLTQSLAILEYLDDVCAAPETLLVWGDAARKAKIRALAQIIACDIHPMNNLSVWKGYLGGVLGVTDDQSTAWYAHWITQGLAAYEAMMDQTAAFSCGAALSLADICLLPQLYNARRFGVDLDHFTSILRVEKNMLALDAVRVSLPENQSDAALGLNPIYEIA